MNDFKILFLSLLLTLLIGGCNNSNIESIAVEYNSFVIVKSLDPSDSKNKYAAFKLLHEPDSNGANLKWVFLSGGESMMDFKSNSVELGTTYAEPKFGIQFKIFTLNYSEKDKSAFWLESLSNEYKNGYTTEFCVTKISSLGELNQKDFSDCFSQK